MNPRHTTSFKAPLGCTQFHSLQSFFDSANRLASGFPAINPFIKEISSTLNVLPLYLIVGSIETT